MRAIIKLVSELIIPAEVNVAVGDKSVRYENDGSWLAVFWKQSFKDQKLMLAAKRYLVSLRQEWVLEEIATA